MPFNYGLDEGNLFFCCAGSRDNYFGSVGKILIMVLSFRHCVKSVRIRSYSGPHFPASDWYWEIRSISLYSVRTRENADQNNSKYGHFYAVRVGTSKHKNIDHWGKETCAMFPFPIQNKNSIKNASLTFLFDFFELKKNCIKKINRKKNCL